MLLEFFVLVCLIVVLGFFFFFVKAVCVIDSFSLMEILKCFGLGFCCGWVFLFVFLSLWEFGGVFLCVWVFVFFSYRSMLPGPEGN